MVNSIAGAGAGAGADPIDLSARTNVKSFIPSEDGTYSVTMTGNISFSYEYQKWKLDQAIRFNTSQQKIQSGSKWHNDTRTAITVTGKKNQPIYLYIVDKASTKNKGHVRVKFTKVEKFNNSVKPSNIV